MNRAMKKAALGATAACMAVSLAACGSSDSSEGSGKAAVAGGGVDTSAPLYSALPADIQKKGSITLGSSIDYPPFEYYAEDGKTLQGFETELMAKVSAQLGVPFDWKNASFDSLFASLDAGRYDIVFGATNDNADREKKYDFVDYLTSSQAFVTQHGKEATIASTDDLCGKKIAAVTGGVQLTYLDAQSKVCTSAGKAAITPMGFDGNSGEQTAVLSGQADALLEGYATAVSFAKGSKGKLALVPDVQVAKSYYGTVVPKEDTQLRDALVKAWNAVIDSGDYAAILKKADLSDVAITAAVVNGATTQPQQ